MIPAIKEIPRSYWVIQGRFAAGEYPCDPAEYPADDPADDPADNPADNPAAGPAQERARGLAVAGIDVVIDLTAAGESGLRPYAPYLFEAARAQGRAVEHRRFPIRDMGIPSVEQMRSILAALDEALESGKNVYLHCWGGKGRTGAVVGCYLVHHGMEGAAALAEIYALRQGLPGDSPETSEQKQFVLDFKRD